MSKMDMLKRILDLAIQIQQIPAPTFEEVARADFVRRMLEAEGLLDIQVDSAGNVLARLPGAGSGSPLLVSAHLDTVFPAGVTLAIKRTKDRVYGPGIGDNSVGVAGLFGLLWMLRERGISLPGDLWLAANTCEEGLGDLKGMKALCDRFGETPKAYLVLEGMAFGHIYHRGTNVRRYKITVHTEGGHSWIDYGQPSAIHELARLVAEIASLHLPALPRTTLNVGRIGGGTSVNTIAPEAWMELDLRSEGTRELAELARRVEALVEMMEQRGVWVEMDVIGQRPAGEIPPSHPLVKLAQSILREQATEPGLTAGSTDANLPLSRGYPALVLGLTRGGKAHSVDEYIEIEPLAMGMEQLVQFVTRVWE
jgi:acetylornithine deacetylase/succinyl-diaminopimelate desuccinylase-like protein